MELGEPEPVGVLDQHQGGIGDVDPDFHHGGRHEDLDLPRREALHHALLFLCLEAAVEEADLEPAQQRVRAQPLELGFGRARLEPAALLDQRHHDEPLPPGAELAGHELDHLRVLLLRRHPRH